MSKYAQLADHLASLEVNEWSATFKEIEDVLGVCLPNSAKLYQAWWANQKGGGHSQTSAWMDAGWRTTNLDLIGARVTFVRDRQTSPSFHGIKAREFSSAQNAGGSPELQRIGGITIAEAKRGLSAHFGVPSESIEITIKG